MRRRSARRVDSSGCRTGKRTPYRGRLARAVLAFALVGIGGFVSTLAWGQAKTICCDNVDAYWRALDKHLTDRKCEAAVRDTAKKTYYERTKKFGDVNGVACGKGTCKGIGDLAGAVTDIAHTSKCIGDAPLVLPTPVTVNVVGSGSTSATTITSDMGPGATLTINVTPTVIGGGTTSASDGPACCCGNEQNKKPSEASPPAPVAVPAVQAIEGSALTVPRAGESRALVIDAPVGFNDGTSTLAAGVNVSPAGLWYSEDDAVKVDPRWSAIHVSVAGAALPRRAVPGAPPTPDTSRTTVWAAALTYDIVPFIVSKVAALVENNDLAKCIHTSATIIADDAGTEKPEDKGDLSDKKPTFGHDLRRKTMKAIRDCVVKKLPLSVDLALALRHVETTMPRTWLSTRYSWTYTSLEGYGGVDIATKGLWDTGARFSVTPAIFNVSVEGGLGGRVASRDVGGWVAATAAFHLFDGVMVSIGPRFEWKDGGRDDRMFVSVGWAGWDWRSELFRRQYDLRRSEPKPPAATTTPPPAN